MDIIDAVRSRRSTARTTDAAPSDEELLDMLAVAAHSPDHAGLRPWRLVTLRGNARVGLGRAMAVGFGEDPDSDAGRRSAAKPLRSPLLIGIVATLTDHPKVPEWEQIAAATALVTTLELVLFDAGWTAMWRTGPAIDSAEVQQYMGLQPSEKLLGWLYIGGTAPDPAGPAPTDPDVSDRLSSLTAD